MNTRPESVGGFMRGGEIYSNESPEIKKLRDLKSTAIEKGEFDVAESIDDEIAELRGEQSNEEQPPEQISLQESRQQEALKNAITDAEIADLELANHLKENCACL